MLLFGTVLGPKLYFYGWVGGWGGVVGEIGSKAISAFNSVEVEVEAELGKNLPLP